MKDKTTILTPEQIDALYELAVQCFVQNFDEQIQKLATKEEILETVDKLNKTPNY